MNASVKEPLDRFQLALLTELRAVVEERRESGPSRAAGPRASRRLGLAAAAVAGTAASVAALTLWGGGSPAFAVDSGTDGAIVVRIHELADATGLEAALAARGVTAQVDYAGSADGPVSIDAGGRVKIGAAPPVDPPGSATDGSGVESGESSNTAGDAGSTGDPGPAGADPCGPGPDGTPPIDLSRDGADYVVTLAGSSLGQDNALRLATISGGGSDALVATYRFADHTCGAMVGL